MAHLKARRVDADAVASIYSTVSRKER
jgi:hypothetical protein